VARLGDEATHLTACHFPVESPEELLTWTSSLTEEDADGGPGPASAAPGQVDPVARELVVEPDRLTERGTF
jgi:hypothetical protein